MGPMSPELSIVVPAHNEAANVAPMVAALRDVLAPFGRWEIIYVDDGSNDGNFELTAKQFCANFQAYYRGVMS